MSAAVIFHSGASAESMFSVTELPFSLSHSVYLLSVLVSRIFCFLASILQRATAFFVHYKTRIVRKCYRPLRIVARSDRIHVVPWIV